MACASARIQVHLLDPIPAIVVARVMDGLRALGMDAVLSGEAPTTSARPRETGVSRSICLTCRREVPPDPAAASRDRRAPVVALPHAPGASRFDEGVASDVLAQVVARLQPLPQAV